MESNRGTVALLVFCVILGVAAIVYVVRSDNPGVKAKEAPAPVAKVSMDEPLPPAPAAAKADPPPPPAAPQENPEMADKPNPKLVVAAVDEPKMPLDEKEGAKYKYEPLPNSGGFIFERPGPDGKPLPGVVVPGHILVRKGVIELFGCAESGKAHETVVQIETDIQALDTALTLSGLKRGRLPKVMGADDPQQGSRVIILIQWEDPNGKTVTHRSEDLVVSVSREKPMPRVGWTYVGQWTEVIDPTTPTLERRHKVLACTGTRSLVTTFRDRSALMDNPLPEAEDDTQFASNYMVLPRSGTPIRIIFRKPTAAEVKEIGEIEKELAQAPVRWKADDREHEHEEKDRSYYDRLKGPGGTPLPEKKDEEKKEP
jgi:hypothetical protein